MPPEITQTADVPEVSGRVETTAADSGPAEITLDGRRYVLADPVTLDAGTDAPTGAEPVTLADGGGQSPDPQPLPQLDGDALAVGATDEGQDGDEGDHADVHTHFHIPLGVVEGPPTSDSRKIKPHALTWRTPPIPLKSTIASAHGNVPTTDPTVIGRIDHLERRHVGGEPDGRGGTYPDGSFGVFGHGTFDTSDVAQDHARMIHSYMHNGVSADIGDATSEHELVLDDYGDPVREAEVLTSGEIMAMTVVPMPAFAGAYIVCAAPDGSPMPAPGAALEDMGVEPIEGGDAMSASAPPWRIVDAGPVGSRRCLPCERGEALTASAGPVAPPTGWFLDPQLEELTPLTITPEGRIYGHLAAWGTCHTGISGQCVTPPKGGSYAHYRTGAVLTAEGDLIPTGPITIGTDHAPTHGRMSASAAREHYDNTGTAAADVAAGEDEHGIWYAGAMRPDVTAEQVRALRASALSGDWRLLGGRLQLVAALAVNVPGFPIPRAVAASGSPLALVAAGAPDVIAAGRRRALTIDAAELDELRGRLAAQERVAGQVLRVGVETLRARVHARRAA